MKSPQNPYDREYDPNSTDTLPLPILKDEDIGRLAAPPDPQAGSDDDGGEGGRETARALALEHESGVLAQLRVVVRDAASGSHDSTDTFHPSALTPMAARPVAASDLAETLREQEQQLQQANERLQRADAQLQQANQQLAELQAQLAAAATRLPPAQAAEPAAPPPSTAPALPPQDGEAAALRRQNARLHEALCSMQARLGVQEAMLAEGEETLRAQAAQGLRAAREVPPVTTPDTVAAPAADADAGAAVIDAGTAAIDASAAATDAAAAPPAAADVLPPDSTARDHALRIDWQARFHELETVLEAERSAAAARSREQAGQSAALQAELATLRSQSARGGAALQSLPIGTMLRVLVREEDGTELAYPLGRHTRIGRTPDNDIQVNTTFVSRHHAVLLTSSEHCIVEDLNSTNGIIVNGQRVGRQLLQDGDVLTIGKTHFRYETRP